MLSLVEPYRPTWREWGAIAIEAARAAGLCDEDLASLRTNLENEWRIGTTGPAAEAAAPGARTAAKRSTRAG